MGGRELFRVIVCAAMWAGLLIVALITLNSANGETANGSDLSAVQVIQVYAEGLFYAVTIIGLGIGLYIASRAGE
jgi:hypothetical protein